LPEAADIESGSDPAQQLSFKGGIVEKAPTCTRVADTNAFACDSKTLASYILTAADNYDCPRTHMLLLAYHLLDIFLAIVRKSLGRMF